MRSAYSLVNTNRPSGAEATKLTTMRKNDFIGRIMPNSVTLVAALFAASFASCSGGEDAPSEVTEEPAAEPKAYTVTLGYAGDILETTQSPLSKAPGNDLLGIHITAATNGSDYYESYAYGLFDDTENITVTLYEGYKYQFEATMIRDAKDLIYRESDGTYMRPFNAQLTNEFAYSSEVWMTDLGYGTIDLKDEDGGWEPIGMAPGVERYYGRIGGYEGHYDDCFTPGESDQVTITMNKMIFGYKFVANGLTEGRIEIYLGYYREPLTIEYPATEVSGTMTFDDIQDAYIYNRDDINVSLTWIKDDNTEISLGNHQVEFVRNMMNTATFNVKEPTASDNYFNIILEDEIMGEGTSTEIDVP